MSTWNPYQVMQMSAIIPSEEEERDPKPYANNLHDRNDRKYAYVSVLLAHMAKITNIDLKSSLHASTYIADHIEWAQFQSSDQLRTVIKDKFLQLISHLPSDADKAEVYNAIMVAISRLTYDYSIFKNSIDETIHKKWALNAIHSGNKELLVSEIERAVDHEHFLLSNDYLCYAYSPYDSNEFKYARLSLLASNLAYNVGMKWDFEMQGLVVDWNSYIAWARFRSVKEMRQDLLSKIQQMISSFPSIDSIVNAYAEITKTILELTDDPLCKEDYSKNYERSISALNENKQEVIMRISKLLDNDHFLIPIGQKPSE